MCCARRDPAEKSQRALGRNPFGIHGHIIEASRRSGLSVIAEDGWIKVKRAVSSPKEVVRCAAQ
jgi:hypothetical protein